MRRIHTTFDLLEAHLVAETLRANGVDVWLLDADIVRQDWFKTIAFGGFRLVAAETSVPAALDILRRYQRGELSLPAPPRDDCPRCGLPSAGHDLQPRRNVFLATIVISFAQSAVWLSLTKLSAMGIVLMFAVQLALNLSIPWWVVRYFKWPMRCDACSYRWRERPTPFAVLAAMVNDASAGRSAP